MPGPWSHHETGEDLNISRKEGIWYETQKILSLFGLVLIITLLFSTPIPAQAQEGQPESKEAGPLTVYTQYPSRIIGFGEVVTVPLKLRSGIAQTVGLEVKNLRRVERIFPGWIANCGCCLRRWRK
jgi:hypothetical protein